MFKKKDWTVYTNPYLLNTTPDLIVQKGDSNFIIEIKAYSHSIACGEVEVAQAIKYFDRASYMYYSKAKFSGHNSKTSNYIEMKSLPKILLITSGDLQAENILDFINGKIDTIEDLNKLVYQHYEGLRNRIVERESLDNCDAYGIYKYAPKKWDKASWEYPFRITTLKECDMKNWLEVLLTEDFDIFLIPSEIFAEILNHEGLQEELSIFNVLKYTPLEELMIDRTILQKIMN